MSRWGDTVATVALAGVAGSLIFGYINHESDVRRLQDEAKSLRLAQTEFEAHSPKMGGTATLQIYTPSKGSWLQGRNGAQFTPDQERSTNSVDPVLFLENSGGSKAVITGIGIVPRPNHYVSAGGFSCYYGSVNNPGGDCPVPIGVDPAQRVTIWFQLTPDLLKEATCTDESDGGLEVYYTLSDGSRTVIKTGTALQEATRCPIKPTTAPGK